MRSGEGHGEDMTATPIRCWAGTPVLAKWARMPVPARTYAHAAKDE